MLALLASVPSAPVASQAFGNAIAVDGDEVFVGEATYEMRSGVVYVFGRDPSGNWIQTQRIEPANGEAGDRFGIGLAKYENTLLISATRADEGTGAVYVYEAQDGTWIESGRLETADRSPADSLGTGLAMNNDWIMVGTIEQARLMPSAVKENPGFSIPRSDLMTLMKETPSALASLFREIRC